MANRHEPDNQLAKRNPGVEKMETFYPEKETKQGIMTGNHQHGKRQRRTP